PASHTTNGFLLLGRNDVTGARKAFNQALDLSPNFSEALEGLLLLDMREKRVPDAVRRIEERLTKSPNDSRVLLVAARTYAAARQLDKSEGFLRRVVANDPDNMAAYLMLGQTYLAQ